MSLLLTMLLSFICGESRLHVSAAFFAIGTPSVLLKPPESWYFYF
ncbi:hypothetical protein GLYMA_08G115451v4 [Glycine max]|nr:hypothetical protein GLYMA_08G115451v4 [Glycine max]KAH1050758.1 hypothetical protein GYH30_020949 [Glycine max]